MKRFWLLFSQSVTVVLACYFVVSTLKPHWLTELSAPLTQVPVYAAPAGVRSTAVQASSFSTAVERAAPAVVSISTSKAPANNPEFNDPWYRFFYGEPDTEQSQTGLGSGVIISADGFILTNHHVVDEADEIDVQLRDGRHAPAHLVGSDPDTDVAVLKIDLPNLPVVVLGDSNQLRVGDAVLAIGNPFGVGQTVTSGIVSALGRNHLGLNTFENFIQTDAAINPGNSGGGLIDINGQLVGINTAIYSKSGGSMGIGFAIPTSNARQVLEAIVRDGTVTRGWIGVEPQELTPELAAYFGAQAGDGVIITGVLHNGPAAQAGIRPGDVIARVAGQAVHNVPELLSAVTALTPGQTAELEVVRGPQRSTVQIVPGVREKPKANTAR